MAFDPRQVLGSPAIALAGAVVIGMGIYSLIRAAIEHLVQPLFNVVFDHHGMVSLSDSRGISIGCGPFIAACMITVVCVGIGFFMIRSSNR